MKSLVFIWFLLGLYGSAVSLIREYLYSPQKEKLSKAENYCKQHYGNLASITTEEEFQRAVMVKSENDALAWIGLKRSKPHTDIWNWTDGAEVSFTKWNNDEPDDFGSGEDCVAMGENGWHDVSCEKEFPTICFRSFVLVRKKKIWDEALRYCRSQYNDSAFVESGAQLNLLKQETQQAETASVWTGLRFLDGKWLWVNGMPLGNLVSLPSCPVWPYRCGAYNFNTNVWENRDCNEAHDFLCYY